MKKQDRLVNVCAWCEERKPKEERVKGAVSHGICVKHYQDMMQKDK